MLDEVRDARRVYVDNLRALIIAAVFVVHVAQVFNPWDEWHITNDVRSRAVGEVAVLLAPWIMPLVMLLAGVSAWHSIQHRSNGAYVRERVTRVLVPLVVGTLVLVPPQVYLERRLHGEFAGSFFAFLPRFFVGLYPQGNLSWHHLWFLGHLFAYSLIALPVFRRWQRTQSGGPTGVITRACAGPLGLFWLALPLVVERQLLWALFPERHMLAADWSNHALLFVAYLYGFILAGEPWFAARIDAQWPFALGTAVAMSGAMVLGTWSGVIPGRIPPPYTPRYLLFWTVYACGAWAWMVAALGMARRWLRSDTPLLRYGHTMSYVWYLVHQPVIVGAAYVIVRWPASVAEKVGALFTVSAAGTLLISELLRRVPGLGGLLAGAARRPAPPRSTPARTRRAGPRWGGWLPRPSGRS
jgi:peptidoglycan/LPS O-acetylase OafA/YrhL